MDFCDGFGAICPTMRKQTDGRAYSTEPAAKAHKIVKHLTTPQHTKYNKGRKEEE